MKHLHFFLLSILLAVSIHAETTLVTPKAAFANTTFNSRTPGQTIDNSGIDETSGTHGTDQNATMWMGSNSGNSGGSKFAKWFVIDLGAVYPLDSMKIWNFNMAGYVNRGVKQIDIYVSATNSDFSGTPTFSDTDIWTLFKENHIVAKASGNASYAGDTPVDFDGILVRWIGFWIDSLHGSSDEYGGLSEVRFWARSGVTISLVGEPSVASTSSATLTGALSYTEGTDYPVRLVYGAISDGDDPADWTGATAWTTRSEGSFQETISSLSPDTEYQTAFCLDKGGSYEYSSAVSFSTASISVSVPANFYESDPAAKTIVFSRPASASALDLTVAYSLGGTAVAETDYAALSGSVIIAAGETSASVVFQPINTAVAEGDRTVSVTILPGIYVAGATASFSILDDESAASSECVWTGAGDGENWESAGNWYPRVPTILDTAKFASSGLTANQSVTISTSAVIKELIIETTTAFTLATDGGSLALGGITRADVEGTEGNHTIAVPLVIYAGNETNCIWNVAGSGSLVINADISKTAGTYVFKTGSGNVNMSYKNTTFTGPWIIREGQITANVNGGNTFRGTVTIGGGDTTAKLVQSQKNSIAATTVVNVYTNGIYQSGDIDNGRAETIRVYEGGLAQIGSYYYMLTLTLQGGTFNGGTGYNTRGITVLASDTMSRLNAAWKFTGGNSDWYDWSVDVARGGAVVDLLVTKQMYEGGSDRIIHKKGNGIVKSTVNFGSLKNHFQINAGTWYVDNPGEYGLGIQETTVASGAKLGGTGCVGMKDVKSYATLELSNGSETKYATLSPGSIDETTGELIYGTFTSGRESAHNKLTLGNWSHLDIGVGPKDPVTKLSPADKLFVYGNLVIGSNCTLDVATKMAARNKLAPGNYTIVEADAITGTFATILRPSAGWTVAYESRRWTAPMSSSASC